MLKSKSFLIVLFLVLAHVVYAHEIRPAYLEIEEVSTNNYRIRWKVPSINDAVPSIKLEFPSSFQVTQIGEAIPINRSMVINYTIRSEKDIRGETIKVLGLENTIMDVLVNISFIDGSEYTFMLNPNHPEGIIPKEESFIHTAKTYLVLGIEHILLGIDHLLFVLALLLITNGVSRLVKTITAFTIAHSITLSLSALGFVGLPGPPVEAVIALSIVFLAVELYKYYKGEDVLTAKYPWVVAFTFGLLHGFGFAGALTEIGLPQTTIPSALLFFNVGVEIGQLVFIMVVLSIVWLINKSKITFPNWVKFVPVYAIGILSSFWLIQRLFSFM